MSLEELSPAERAGWRALGASPPHTIMLVPWKAPDVAAELCQDAFSSLPSYLQPDRGSLSTTAVSRPRSTDDPQNRRIPYSSFDESGSRFCEAGLPVASDGT